MRDIPRFRPRWGWHHSLTPIGCRALPEPGDFATARHRVLVVSNSFSASFSEAFDDLVANDDVAVSVTSAWALSPASADAYWNPVVSGLIDWLRPGDRVFLVNDIVMFSPPSKGPGSRLLLQTLRVGLTDF